MGLVFSREKASRAGAISDNCPSWAGHRSMINAIFALGCLDKKQGDLPWARLWLTSQISDPKRIAQPSGTLFPSVHLRIGKHLLVGDFGYSISFFNRYLGWFIHIHPKNLEIKHHQTSLKAPTSHMKRDQIQSNTWLFDHQVLWLSSSIFDHLWLLIPPLASILSKFTAYMSCGQTLVLSTLQN